MGATLDALNADSSNLAVTYVAQIEGFNTLLVSSDPDTALTAWQASALPGCADVLHAVAGLTVRWEQHQQHSPWVAFGQPPTISLSVVADIDEDGVLTDVLGETFLKRAGNLKTSLTTSMTPAATAAVVRSTAAFTAPGVIHCGSEAIGYDTLAATEFQDLTRGLYSPFHTDGGYRFARSHQVVDPTAVTGDPIGVRLPPEVGDEQRGWVGRHVAVWICRRLTDRAIDGPDEAHLAFAGTIADIGEGADGETVIECEHVLRSIYERRLLANPYQATAAEGVQLKVGASNDFACVTKRDGTTSATANPLTIVAGVPASVNEIQEGVYTIYELGEAINAWLQAEYAAARLTFSVSYAAAFDNGTDGPRGVLSFSDSGGVSADARRATLTLPTAMVSRFLGWDEELDIAVSRNAGFTGWRHSPKTPLRFHLANTERTVIAVNPRGEWIDQASILPPALQGTTGAIEGVIRIGDLGHAAVAHVSDTEFTTYFATAALSDYLPAISASAAIDVPVDSDADLTISQVIIAQDTFKNLLLKVLFSTGASAFNHATYDTLSADLGCASPYQLFGADFEADVDAVADVDQPLIVILRKPTRFVDLFNVDFQLRWCFLTWGAGRVHLKVWGTPTAGNSVLSIDDEDKAVPEDSAGSDHQRSTSRERFEFIRNMVTVKWGQDVDGNLAMSPIPIVDLDSMAAHGHRALELEARNTLANSSVGDFLGVVSRFGATLPLFSRPHRIVHRTMGQHHFEQLIPGTFVTVTDRHIRNPETGLRYDRAAGTGGLTGWPGIVVGNEHSWGGSRPGLNGEPPPQPDQPLGEVDILIFDRVTAGPYSPAAQVDETANSAGFSAGYNNGTLTLKLRAHEHSEASGALDSSQFAVNDAVRIIQIDPDTAAAPLTWLRSLAGVSANELVLDAALAAPAWDATKIYRVIPDVYSSVEASQRATAYQADDEDGLVENARQPYGMVVSGTGQANPFTAAAATELPARWATASVGDGVPLDCANARDAARMINNQVSYKTGPQMPSIVSESWSGSPGGTWALLAIVPVAVGIGVLSGNQTRKLYVAPQFRSKDGSSVSVRYSLCKLWPQGATRDDVTLVDPYVSTTFTTTSTTYTTPTAVGLDIRHLNLGPGPLGGLGWLVVESNSGNAELIGQGHLRVGPVVSP